MARTHLMAMPVLQFFDNTGNELNGGTLTFYEAGTTTLKDTYADAAQAVTNPNPITLDSAGRPDNSGSPIQIWLDGTYKVVVKDSSGNTIRTEDNITAFKEPTGYVSKSSNYTVVSTDYGKLIDVDATSGNITITLTEASVLGSGFTFTVRKNDASANTVTVDPNGSEQINGSATFLLASQYSGIQVVCDGTGFHTFIGELVLDASPQLGADLDVNGNKITGAIDLDSTGDIELRLGDNAGTNKVNLRDSDDVVQATLDSDGDLTVNDLTANGVVQLGGSTSLEIPNGASPTLDADGETAVDTSVTGLNGGLLKYYRGEIMGCVAMPEANFSGMADGYVVSYNATDGGFEVIKASAGDAQFRAYLSSAQSVASNTTARVNVDTVVFDPLSDFDSTTNFRYTPSVAGKYFCYGSGGVAGMADQKQLVVYLRKNGTADIQSSAGASGVPPYLFVGGVIEMNGSTDYIDLAMYNGDSVSRNTYSGSQLVFMGAFWISE